VIAPLGQFLTHATQPEQDASITEQSEHD